ncbi:IQ motif and ubiquitin-like domain-containing protein isoform 1-T2 [Spinachia spinachia]
MSEQRGNEELQVEENTEPRGEGHEEQAARSTPGERRADHQVREPHGPAGVGSSMAADVPEEDAGPRAVLQDEAAPHAGEGVGSSTATVKVVLVPGGHVMTVAFAIGLRVRELKLHLAAELRVPAEVLQISLDGRVVEEQRSLMELGVQPQGSTRMEMSSTDPTAHPLRPLRPPERDNVPDVITVRVQTDKGVSREVVVEIERPPQQKAFLGGYRHRLTEVEYHHAAAQTPPKRRPDRGGVVFCRDTQTVHVRSRAQQRPADVATQMTAVGCYVSCTSDRLVAARGAYVTAEERHGARLRAVGSRLTATHLAASFICVCTLSGHFIRPGVVCQLEPVRPLTSDLWHQRGVCAHRTELTGYFLFLGPFSVNPEMVVGENPSRSAVCETLRAACLAPTATFKVTSVTFLPRSDARFDLQHIVFTKSTGLNALSCCRVIGWLEMCLNAECVCVCVCLSPAQVIRLQAFVRRWLARQEVDRLRRDRDRRLAWLQLQERRRRWEKEEQLTERRLRQTNPQRRKDFHLLYHALETWRREEEQRISGCLRGADRKAALCSLLEVETQLISGIERHHVAARDAGRERAVSSLLDESAAPHRWRAADGRMVEMDSEHTVRARELRELYEGLSHSSVSREQRLHVLLTLKHTVKEHECQLTRDVVGLIDREVDLMTRGVKAARLEGLRKRISTLFLQYIKTPAFNPGVAKLLKVPQKASQLKNDMFLCGACRRYLLSSDFSPTAGARPSARCRDCIDLDNVARSREDFSRYENILRRLRADEQLLNAEAKIPFLLQVEDLRYLVEVVWASRSALQARSDLYDLVLVRWERRTDWSPWNCILLSKEEAPAHLEVEDVHKAYEATFIRRIQHKHVLARRHFSQIPVMAEHLGDQLVPKTVAVVTGRRTSHTSAREGRGLQRKLGGWEDKGI